MSDPFRSAILKYASQSTFARAADGEKRIVNRELGELWIDAASILESRFLSSAEDFGPLVKNFGVCFTIGVFWNHVTAAFDELLGGSAPDGTDPEQPLLRLLARHAGHCSACERAFQQELAEYEARNWTREFETPFTVIMTLLRDREAA